MSWIDERDGRVYVIVHVQPRSSREGIAGCYGDTLKVRVTAPPVEGAANAACIALFAQLLNVSRASITIAAGETARRKRMRIDGVTREQVEAVIARAQAKG